MRISTDPEGKPEWEESDNCVKLAKINEALNLKDVRLEPNAYIADLELRGLDARFIKRQGISFLF